MLIKAKLNELGTVARGKSKHRPRNDPSLYGGQYPFIQTGGVKAANLYITEYEQTYNEKGLLQSKLWDKGTLCITIAANIAETGILGINACFPDSIIGFTANNDKCDVLFIKYYIDTIKMKMQNISRGTTQDNLSLEKLLSIEFEIPEVSIQRKIASILSAYDDLIQNNLRRIKILEEMAQRIYQEWFVHFRFPGHVNVKMVESELGFIPEGWQIASLNDICISIQSGGTPSRKEGTYWYNGDINWFKTKEFEDRFLFQSEEKITELGLKNSSARIYRKGTILMAIYGATIGKLAILANPSACNQAACGFTVDSQRVTNSYLYYTLLNLRHHFKSIAQGAAQQNISAIKVKETQFVCAPPSIVFLFNTIIENQFNMLRNLIEKNQILRQTRDLLLPRLISGEINMENLDINILEESE